ncbi:MMS19 nucleotide excision repair protein homolog [Clavelina lepadiformis]|uniref:MMS19 nucleotide excision repair protein homolog n=1 Tax=Clavelina lepadiformis TaxID=159417 RepID=UPI0040420C90
MDELVKLFMNDLDDHDDEILKASLQVQEGKLTVLNLVEELGPHLTNTDTEARVKGCKLLTKILENLPDTCLSTKELATLVIFLCSRLQDHYTLQPPALSGLVKLTASTNLAEGEAKIVINSIFKEVHVQSCLQAERLSLYLLLTNIVSNHKSLILSLGRNFLYNFIQAIDGEQDPRNLLVVFQLAYDVISTGIDLLNLAEELFDVISCYFPIDFNPSSGGKFSITNQDLVLGLRRVLSSTNAFAQFCIPLMLEKLDSDIESAKVDACLTFSECLSQYKKIDLEPYLGAIWNTLKQEITQSVSEEVENSALDLLTELVRTLSLWPVLGQSYRMVDLNSFLNEVLEECLTRLKEPIRDKLTWMSWRIIMACAKASKTACDIVCKAVFPLLLEQVSEMSVDASSTPLAKSNFANIMDCIVKMATVCSNFTFSYNPVLPHKDAIMKSFQDVLSKEGSVQVKCTAVAGLAVILGLNILSDENLRNLATVLLSSLMSQSDPKVRFELLSASGYLSSKHPKIVKACMLPTITKLIPETEFWHHPKEIVRNTLECLSALSTHFDILQDVVSYVVDFLFKCKIEQPYCCFLLECLGCLETISKNSTAGDDHTDHLVINIALPLIKICIKTSVQLTVPELCCASCTAVNGFSIDCISLPIIKAVTAVLRNIFQNLRVGKTAKFIVKLLTDIYLNGNIAELDISEEKLLNFDPFNPKFALLQSRMICFLHATLCAVDRSVTIPHIEDFQSKLLNLCLHSDDQPTYVAAAKTFAGLVNRAHKSSDKYMQDVLDCSVGKAKGKKLQVLTLLIWTTKALALCNHEMTKAFIQKLVGLFGDPDIGETAAAGCDIIMRDSKEVLSPSSHAVVRLMYRQRFFLLIIPELVAGFHSAKDTPMEISQTGDLEQVLPSVKQAHCLTALSHLLLHLPKQVLLQQFSHLTPLLVKALHSDDAILLQSVLSALLYLIEDAAAPMEAHIDSLINDFLRLSRFKPNLDVRLKALKCIGASTLLPTTILLPIKKKVVQELRYVLDDHKRDVRSEAAKARSEWYLVGT